MFTIGLMRKEKTGMMPRKTKGILCIILAAFCFAGMNLCIRLAGEIPTLEKTFFRNLVAMILAFFILRKDKISYRPDREDVLLLTIRCVLGTLGIWCNFYAIDHLPIADASMLNKLSPFFVIILSAIFLKEHLTAFQVSCVALAFIGTLFVVRPSFDNVALVPALLGVFGGFGAGAAYTCVHRLGEKSCPGSLIVFLFSAFSCVAAIPGSILHFVMPTGWQLLMLVLTGVCAAGGQFSITSAYTFAAGRDISVYDYTQILFAALLGYVFLHELPDAWSFVGYAIIITAALMMFIKQQWERIREHEMARTDRNV